jgi:hypothetical protein
VDVLSSGVGRRYLLSRGRKCATYVGLFRGSKGPFVDGAATRVNRGSWCVVKGEKGWGNEWTKSVRKELVLVERVAAQQLLTSERLPARGNATMCSSGSHHSE